MSEIPDFVRDLVHKIAKSEGLIDYKIDVKPGTNHGDNLFSDMLSVTITGQRTLHLLCKLAPTNEARRQHSGSLRLFRREALMYNKIFPLFDEFQREKGLKPEDMFTAYPKCHVAIADDVTDQFVIIMDDLRPQGYAMWPKAIGTPLAHEYLVMEQLGKLHGISLALKDQRPDVYESLRALKDVIVEFFEHDSMTQLMHAAYDKVISVLDNVEHKRIMGEMREHVQKFHEDLLTGDCDPFGVVGHSDCWNNNLIYRYEHGVC